MPKGVRLQTKKFWPNEEEEGMKESEECSDEMQARRGGEEKEEKGDQEAERAMATTKVRAQTDSDWATDRVTRRSVSGGSLYLGWHLVKSWSKEQGLTAMSSAEAELYAAILGGQQVLGLKSLLQDLGLRAEINLEVDASAAIGIINRQGLGRTRHVDVRYLWLQEQVRNKAMSIYKLQATPIRRILAPKHLRLR